jgi:putative salt-induced outer membrane protein YdiY
MYQRALLIGILCLAVGSASADTLVLANGDKLNCEIVEWAVDHVVIDHPQLGRMRISLEQLELDTGKPPNPGLFGTGFLRGWTRRIDLGINGKEGNSVSTNVTSGLAFSYADDWTRWRINGRYLYDREDGGDSDNNARLDIFRDWLFPESRWFIRLGGIYQFDQFEAWRHRVTLAGGPGLHLLETEAHKIDLVLGPAFTREFGDSQANKAESILELDYTWTISERQSFSVDNNFFLETSPDAGAIRNFTRVRWSLALLERPKLSLNLGVDNEYESRPEDGDKANDLTYLMTLGIDL